MLTGQKNLTFPEILTFHNKDSKGFLGVCYGYPKGGEKSTKETLWREWETNKKYFHYLVEDGPHPKEKGEQTYPNLSPPKREGRKPKLNKYE